MASERKKTPISFRNACDDFIFTENLGSDGAGGVSQESNNKDAVEGASALVPVLRKAWEQYQDDNGWANVASAGSFVKRSKPDFDPRTYGVTKLPEVIALLDNEFEMTKYKGKGIVNIVAYRPKNA